MATVFFKKDRLIKKEWETRQFPTLDEAQEWVRENKRKSKWFSVRHISNADVTEMPLFLALSNSGCGQYMRRLYVIEECNIHKSDVVIAPAPQGLKARQDLGAFSSNGSAFSVGASKRPTYIDVFEPRFATLVYVLLGPCEKSIEGVDYALANALLEGKPELHFEFPHEAELLELQFGAHKLVTKAMRQRIAELESAENTAREKFYSMRNQAFTTWYASVVKACM